MPEGANRGGFTLGFPKVWLKPAEAVSLLSHAKWNVRFGSLADMLGCMKESPLYPLKQTFCGAAAALCHLVDIRLLLVPVLDAWDADETDR